MGAPPLAATTDRLPNVFACPNAGALRDELALSQGIGSLRQEGALPGRRCQRHRWCGARHEGCGRGGGRQGGFVSGGSGGAALQHTRPTTSPPPPPPDNDDNEGYYNPPSATCNEPDLTFLTSSADIATFMTPTLCKQESHIHCTECQHRGAARSEACIDVGPGRGAAGEAQPCGGAGSRWGGARPGRARIC